MRKRSRSCTGAWTCGNLTDETCLAAGGPVPECIGATALLAYLAWILALGPDPGKWLLDHLGQGALVFLLITLAMTPLSRLTGWPHWLAIRRQLGLWSFVYACLHIACFLLFILGAQWDRLPAEIGRASCREGEEV